MDGVKLESIRKTLNFAEAELIQKTREAKIEFGQVFLVLHYENGKMNRAQAAHNNIVESWLLRVK